ncbi:hypothetical protein RR48_04052 [Papilio machaon]|uniref:CCR4-NOT transcription complex subunit 3 n=1 Tax=Papilio machaon TaxID=76193 RepID=A0A0N0PAV6_PAPMA|nr:hypothetical protein RR48_04052 [Papilio machaon]
MAASRKLQGEIDRCLKKVTEGVETFEDIWKKVHNATNSNQKEKYEADLKKEIKKLQRLRDQIKSWIASGEIKDKSTLLDNRKLIETQMERFKVVERETKTKAYSKEGLGAAQKLDPAQKEREEMSSWLSSSIDALNLHVDLFESEVESLLVGKKKRLDKEKQDRMEELKVKLEKHRFHIKKLETLLRMLDNMSVEVDQIKRIKDDVEYYIVTSFDSNYDETDCIYDDINGLDEIELSGVGLPSSATTDSNNSNDSPGSPTSILSGTSPITSPALDALNHSTDSIDVDKKKKAEELVAKPVKPLPLRAVNSCAVSNSATNLTSLLNNSAASTNSINTTGASGTSTPIKLPLAPSPPHLTHLHQRNNTEIVENGPVSIAPLHNAVIHQTPLAQPLPFHTNAALGVTKLPGCKRIMSGGVAVVVFDQTGLNSSHPDVKKRVCDAFKREFDERRGRGGGHAGAPRAFAPTRPRAGTCACAGTCVRARARAHAQRAYPTHQCARTRAASPSYRRQVLLPHSDSVEFFQRLSTETLFFVFYYMEGTKAQYLAAKALKKQSWRFHTKYMMWFQRHEEPKVINEEYEQGTYIYFDYEKWGQRKKEGFTFEYKYLEDRDLN